MAALSLRTWCASRKKSPHHGQCQGCPRCAVQRTSARAARAAGSEQCSATDVRRVSKAEGSAAEPFHATPVCVSALSVPYHVQLGRPPKEGSRSRSGRRKDRKGLRAIRLTRGNPESNSSKNASTTVEQQLLQAFRTALPVERAIEYGSTSKLCKET